MYTINLIILMCLATALGLAATGQTTRTAKPPMNDNVLERSVIGAADSSTTAQAFYRSLRHARVPGGSIRITGCDDDEVRHWERQNSPLSQVLDALTAVDPTYRWKLEDGVVNLIPTAGAPQLLRVKIKAFAVEKVTSEEEALHPLLALPEVRNRMSELGLKFPPIILIMRLRRPNPAEFNVYCRDATLLDALNAIVRAEGSGVWNYIETHCGDRHELMIRFL